MVGSLSSLLGSISSLGEGKVISTVCGIISRENREMRRNILLPLIVMLLGRISSGEEGKGH